MAEGDSLKQNTTNFLDKLYTILEVESLDIISWSPSGDSFIIYNPQLFSQNIMCKYFKSSKFNSFVRQLNFYGFRKSSRDQLVDDRNNENRTWEFKHPYFIRGRKDLISKIHRKQIGDTESDLQARITQLENESSYLYNLVNELLIWRREVCNRYPSLMTESMVESMKQVPIDYMTSGKVDPVPSYDNSVKAWPQNLLSSSLTYTAQNQPVLSVPNSVVVPPETASSRQNTYMNSAVVPGKNDSTNLPIFITKRQKQTPPKREGPSQGSEFSTMEPPNGEDPLKSNIPATIYSKDFFPPQGYL